MNLLDTVQSQPAYILWLLAGLMFLGIAMLAFEPTIVAFGFAAIITGIAAISVREFSIQLLIWGVLSVSLAIVLRGFVPRHSKDLGPVTQASVSQTIPPGGVGEVTYEGSYWTARCQISDVAIAVGQIVQVVGRQGNTLIVLPTQSPNDTYNRTA
ncbi:NfeD family protein [Oscillatoria sp. FACHB-1407]|uniref:NfeD family protein n=1 Tax=Oscillatoria sp. FACHB-1407 TaxID=2692847 RepID=UPI0016865F19|nr:NfeD family protein [Oscillatoria sp. FACHB-1407]MBD2459759.1 NfeD family protein [Oscillatoria sp. FACHB-1407]